jgi:hypothetical protein
MKFKDKTNSSFFMHEGNRFITPPIQAPPQMNTNVPELGRIITLVRFTDLSQYEAYIQQQGICPEYEYNEEGEVISHTPTAPIEGQQRGVLNIGDDAWVLKTIGNVGVLHPFPIMQGMFIPLNEVDRGFEQTAYLFRTEQDALDYISVHQIDMSGAFYIWQLNPDLINQ